MSVVRTGWLFARSDATCPVLMSSAVVPPTSGLKTSLLSPNVP